MTRWSCYVESYWQCQSGIEIEVIALCPKHAWSLCDSHGGAVKQQVKRADIRDEYPPSESELKQLLEDGIRSTHCYPQDRIPIQHIKDTLFFNRDPNDISQVRGISEIGSITYPVGLRGDLSLLGLVKARALVGVVETLKSMVPMPSTMVPYLDMA